ncbi:MAG: BON domain-containing protein, partial [Woeseia sp.]
MKMRTIPTVITSSLLLAGLVTPVAFANDDVKPTMEQRTENVQSAISDAWLDGKIESALLFNEHLNSFAIDTEVRDGVAYLSGSVESDIDRALAGEIAESVTDVRKVENKLTVDKGKVTKASHDDADSRKGFKQSVANATLTARIKTALLVESNTAGMAIDVDSKNGDVTLTGKVDSEQEKELAEQIAKKDRKS